MHPRRSYHVHFYNKATNTFVSDAELPAHVKKAEGFLFASFDDFGIVAIEALAAGTPVIAYKAGGALDYVEEGKTGLFFDEQTADSLCSVLQHFDHNAFDPRYITQYAQRFSVETFKQQMTKHITDVTTEHPDI